jgi:ribosome biogenesis GTPase
MMVLRRGGILIDNPGIKEVQLWVDEAILRERFADITALASQCRFDNCKHRSDTGCAIQEALNARTIDAERYEGFLRLEEEITALDSRKKKRQMTIERIHKRESRNVLRNRNDRRENDWRRQVRRENDEG